MIARLWREHRLLFLAFVLAFALTLFLGVRAVVFAVYWSDPARQDQAVAGWMTPGFVAQSWSVPPEVVGEALGLEPGSARGRTLSQIAEARGLTVDELAEVLDAAIAAFRENGG